MAAASTYPVMLRSTNPAAASMTIANAANDRASLRAGLWWWPAAAVLVVAYFVNLVRTHAGEAGAYGVGGEEDEESDAR
jgi:hypothetical protein